MITIIVNYIDGSQSNWNEGTNVVSKLMQLEEMNYQGKELLDVLITDDWGVPPKSIIIEGVYKNKNFKRIISYE